MADIASAARTASEAPSAPMNGSSGLLPSKRRRGGANACGGKRNRRRIALVGRAGSLSRLGARAGSPSPLDGGERFRTTRPAGSWMALSKPGVRGFPLSG